MNMFIFRHLLIILFIGLCIFQMGCDNSGTKDTEEHSILFTNVTAIDAKFGERNNINILVTNNKIAKVSMEQINSPSNCITIDGTGKYLIPGLWDAHVHLTFTPGLEESMFPLFIANGITSIRDTGGLIDLVLPWKDKAKQEPNSSPNVFIAGPLLDGLPNVYDGSPGRPEISIGLESPKEAEETVVMLKNKSVDLIKSYEMLTPEEFIAILNRSKEQGLFVTGHVPLSMDVIEASDAGLRSMEHLRNLEMACSKDFDSLLNERRKMLLAGKDSLGGKLRSYIHRSQRLHAINSFDEERTNKVLARLAENDTWQIPTTALLTGGINRLYEDDTWQKTFQYLPKKVKSIWINKANNSKQKKSSELSLVHGEWGLQMIAKLKSANVKILAGTDTPISYLTPGFSLHKELEMLVKGGLKPIEAIESATILPAKYFDLEATMGTIEPSKLADLVLLDANPLSNIKNTTKISAVVRNGTYYNREALNNLLQLSSEKD